MRIKWSAVLELFGLIFSMAYFLRITYMLTIYSMQTSKIITLTWFGLLLYIASIIIMCKTMESLIIRFKNAKEK